VPVHPIPKSHDLSFPSRTTSNHPSTCKCAHTHTHTHRHPRPLPCLPTYLTLLTYLGCLSSSSCFPPHAPSFIIHSCPGTPLLNLASPHAIIDNIRTLLNHGKRFASASIAAIDRDCRPHLSTGHFFEPCNFLTRVAHCLSPNSSPVATLATISLPQPTTTPPPLLSSRNLLSLLFCYHRPASESRHG
jgi:hypothetical protein